MSSLPGLTLESYVLWNYDLIVESQPDANFSLALAEALGKATCRLVVTEELFKEILEPFEPHREHVENLLLDFDDDTQSWRDYAGACFDFLPDLYQLVVHHAKETTMSSRSLLKIAVLHQSIHQCAETLDLKGSTSEFYLRVGYDSPAYFLELGFCDLTDFGYFNVDDRVYSTNAGASSIIAELSDVLKNLKAEIEAREKKKDTENKVLTKVRESLSEDDLKSAQGCCMEALSHLPEFLELTRKKFPSDFFTHGHCHDLATALHESLGGQLWVAFADRVYDHTVLELGDTTWDIDGREAILRWNDMNSEFRVEFTDWKRFSPKKLRRYLPICQSLVEEIKNDYQQWSISCLKKT